MGKALEKKLAQFKSQNPQAKVEPLPPDAVHKPSPPARTVEVYYDSKHGSLLAKNSRGEFQVYGRSDLRSRLRDKGFSDKLCHASGLSYLDAELLRIVYEDNVHWAGEISGFHPGRIDVYGHRFLVTIGPTFITPKAGKWDNLKRLVQELLKDQAKYFYGWIKHAIRSLRAGEPWAPGQLLAIAGPPRCGKSVLQKLITFMLGGRVSSPYDYMIGETNFNADVYGAEHGMIGDTNHATDHRSRRQFGAAIKKLVVEPVHKFHDKGKTGFSCSPYVRLTITLNENPEALLVLPSLDTDVRDKIILLHAYPRDIDADLKRFGSWPAYEAQLRSELPAFLHAMNRWEIPESIRCVNYGVVSFHAEKLVAALTEMSQDHSLLNVIDSYLLFDVGTGSWKGSATDLIRDLSKAIGNSGGSIQLPPEWKVGQLLTRIAELHKDRVHKHDAGGHRTRYEIFEFVPPPPRE